MIREQLRLRRSQLPVLRLRVERALHVDELAARIPALEKLVAVDQEVMVAAVMAKLLSDDKALAAKLTGQANPPIESRIGARVGALRPTAAFN